MRVRSLLQNLFHRRAAEEDLNEEVSTYVELLTEEKKAAGMAPQEARHRALAEIGGAERLKQAVRERRLGTTLESVGQDVRLGVRQLVKSPGFGITVVVTLALSIGITTAVFSVLYAMLIRPLPYRDVSQIVALDTRSASGGSQSASYPEYLDWRRMSHSFTVLAGFQLTGTVGLENDANTAVLREVQGTDNFFDVFGVNPIIGRTFAAGEDADGRNNVVVLSYEVWRQEFGGRDSVVGERVRMDGSEYTVIGVMPAGFRFPINVTNAVYVPLHLSANKRQNRGNHWLKTVARLKPGVLPKQAEADLETIFAALGRQDTFNAGRTVTAVDLTTYTVGHSAGSLLLLLYAVGAVLAIGCVNVAGLLLARGVKREREMALRSAIGAPRLRIVRQLMTEALVFAVCGAAGGVVIAFSLLRVIRLLLIAALSRGAEVGVNLPTLAAALAISVAVTVVAALIPGLRLSATSPTLALKAGGNAGSSRGQNRLRTGFVVTQVALALALLLVSGLLLHMLRDLRNTQLGFSADRMLTVEINLPHGRYQGRDVVADFYNPLLDRVRALPGVRSAGLIHMLPVQGAGWNWEHIHIMGTPPLKNPRTDPAELRFVSDGYYQVFEDRLIEGRLLDPSIDRPTTRLVTVVNEAFVKKFIPAGRDPVGMEIGEDGQTNTLADQGNPRVLIVGVVKNLRQTIYQPPLPELDYLIAQVPGQDSLNALGGMHLVIRTAVDPVSIVPALRRSFQEVDQTVPMQEPITMQEVIADVLTFERLENWLFGAFAGLALILSIVGLYGLITHEVELSTRDFGIRLALGASRRAIFSGIYRRVGWMLGGGIAIGLLLTTAAQRFIRAVVAIEVEKDGLLMAALAVALLVIGFAAALMPARRAASVEPMEALRDE